MRRRIRPCGLFTIYGHFAKLRLTVRARRDDPRPDAFRADLGNIGQYATAPPAVMALPAIGNLKLTHPPDPLQSSNPPHCNAATRRSADPQSSGRTAIQPPPRDLRT